MVSILDAGPFVAMECNRVVWSFLAVTFGHQAQADRTVGSCEVRGSPSQRAVDVSVAVQWQRSYMESRDGHTHQILRSKPTHGSLMDI